MNLVARERTTQHAHDRDGSSHCSLEVEVHAGVIGSFGQLVRMSSHQRLVRGNHRLTGIQRGQHELAGKIDTANDLDDQVDVVAHD